MAQIGSKIDQLHKLRDKVRAHEEHIKELNKQRELLEAEIMGDLDAQGLSKATGKLAAISITENVKPNVKDWDAFYEFIRKRKYFHLLERRPSVSGCRELFETKGSIPGVEPYVKRTLNMRSSR